MSKEQTSDLLKFLKPFDDNIIDLVLWLRDFAWDLCPQANELIYDNYNAKVLNKWKRLFAKYPVKRWQQTQEKQMPTLSIYQASGENPPPSNSSLLLP